MTKQEQVKEILEVIKHCDDYTNRDCAECDYRLYDECKNQKQCEAEALYNAGYRKIDDLKAENEELTKVVSSKVYDFIDNAIEIADARETWERQAKIDVLNELRTHLYAVYGTNTAYPYYVYGTNRIPLGNKTAEDIVKNIDELLKEYE